MPDDTHVVVSEVGVRQIMAGTDLRDMLMDMGEPIASRARAGAPKKTGLGAASIRAEPFFDGFTWTVRISWTRDRYYMYFRDRGTQYQRGQDFLEAALEGEL